MANVEACCLGDFLGFLPLALACMSDRGRLPLLFLSTVSSVLHVELMVTVLNLLSSSTSASYTDVVEVEMLHSGVLQPIDSVSEG